MITQLRSDEIHNVENQQKHLCCFVVAMRKYVLNRERISTDVLFLSVSLLNCWFSALNIMNFIWTQLNYHNLSSDTKVYRGAFSLIKTVAPKRKPSLTATALWFVKAWLAGRQGNHCNLWRTWFGSIQQ